MRFRLSLLFLILSGICAGAHGQDLHQRVRGQITDATTQAPVPGAVVVCFVDSTMVGGGSADAAGQFVIDRVPVGPVSIRVSMTGYLERWYNRVEVTSAKEVVLSVSLEQSATMLIDVVITGVQDGQAINEMATTSARQFSVEETDRYAGSRGDPARMASNFAGVQGADDSRNDIVIRGNSPQGLLWRLEGIDLPNPNHFAIPGTAGGPLSIINNKYLSNSDFYTGAFPAEYGNTISGVFDLNMRNGNSFQHELSGQLGFLGTEVFAEGPIGKEDSTRSALRPSYLVSYRYSTLRLFSALQIPIGTSAVPGYQDGAVRLNFPGKDGSSLSVWGIGGSSSVDILISEQSSPDERNIYGDNDRDQYYRSKTGVLGATWKKPLSESVYLKVTLAGSTIIQDSYHELVYRHLEEGAYVVDSLRSLLDYRFQESRFAFSSVINWRLNRRITVRAGFIADQFRLSYTDSVRIVDTASVDYYQWRVRWNSRANVLLSRGFIQSRIRPTDKLTLSAGVYVQDVSLGTDVPTPEFRAGIGWVISAGHTVKAGFGLHSQMQPLYLHFYQDPDAMEPQNREMGLTKSRHFVLGYEWSGSDWRVMTELYYQWLSSIPVEERSSSFSLANTGAGFNRFFPGQLVNAGLGKNLGIEFTAERFFKRGWLFLFTASMFDSQYTGSDGVWRNTDFNGRYALNALGSKEWRLSRNRSLVTGMKLTTAGGRWYGPADIQASNQEREVVFVDSLRNTLQFRPYFRYDIKINLRINRPRVTHEIGLDLVNVLNTRNVLKLTYAPDESGDPSSSIREEYQLGFLPIFFYRIDI